MSDCRFGVSPVNYPDPDPDRHDGHADKDSYRHDRRADSHCQPSNDNQVR